MAARWRECVSPAAWGHWLQPGSGHRCCDFAILASLQGLLLPAWQDHPSPAGSGVRGRSELGSSLPAVGSSWDRSYPQSSPAFCTKGSFPCLACHGDKSCLSGLQILACSVCWGLKKIYQNYPSLFHPAGAQMGPSSLAKSECLQLLWCRVIVQGPSASKLCSCYWKSK